MAIKFSKKLFGGSKEEIPASELTAQELVGVDEINDQFIYTKDKLMYGYLSVRAMGDSLLSDTERSLGFRKVTRALEKEKQSWQLISVPRVINTQEMINHLVNLRKRTTHEARLNLLNGEIESIKDMAHEGVREPMILLKMWQKEEKGGEQKLEKRIADMGSNLRSVTGLSVARLENPDLAFLCKQFSELSLSQDGDDSTGELPVLLGEDSYNTEVDILNEITPIGGIEIKKNSISIGGTVGKLHAVTGYPRELNPGWLTDIMNNTEAVTSITFDPANPHLLAEALSKSVSRSATEALSSKDHRASRNAERKAKDADAMLEEIDAENELIGRLCVVVMPFAADDEKLEEVCNRTRNLFSTHRIKLKVMGQLQKEGFKTISPYNPVPHLVNQAFTRLMPLYTYVGGSPMCINSYQDDKGFYFARTNTGNIVSLDFWFRGGDRTNSNFLTLGKAGMGKSTLIKHIIQIEFMAGTKILIIDPESEYREITEFLNGKVFYAGGGEAKINILQVRPSPDDEEELEELRLYKRAQKGNDLAMHLKNLDTFFRTYLVDAPEKTYAVLERTLLQLYKSFHIEWETDCSKLTPTQFPVMSNLVDLLDQLGKADKDCEDLAARLYSAGKGADSFIFNGHTNLDLAGDVISFDTNSLQNSDDKIKRAQYLNILGLCWEIMSRDRDEKVLLICDEAYLLVDHNLPQSLMYLRNIEKRCRKFDGALGIATHSIVDLLHPSIRQYGQAILDISTYKYFLAADGQNLKEITNLYDLTDAQQDILRSGSRGEALAMLGSTMLHLMFVLPQYKLNNMGKAGGN